ncbi:MAG: glycerophosphodiester phosphodiesterase family protein [Caldilineaceae bacterium]
MKWQEFRAARQAQGKPFVVAHRGVSALAPENTLRAFALALAQGAFALETDLRFTKDDQIVLFHDDTLAHDQ